MSIQTDLASLEVIATVHQSSDMEDAIQQMVAKLQQDVPYFDWVGIYLYQGEDMVLKAASDMENQLTWESNSELRIPIEDESERQYGKIVVRSRQPICFDITDVSTLKTLAKELRQRLTVN
ncbi:GAF domain-containing protein [Caldalkalibacillus salinus]|uniref:GAF domain-containing protein n=1 Tax=Caldalkalibacillus salinus TaxID=2803787 RepID=UPI001920BE08|nr:GAF domain-containing protein [Caldalkalibacillus salinus]